MVLVISLTKMGGRKGTRLLMLTKIVIASRPETSVCAEPIMEIVCHGGANFTLLFNTKTKNKSFASTLLASAQNKELAHESCLYNVIHNIIYDSFLFQYK